MLRRVVLRLPSRNKWDSVKKSVDEASNEGEGKYNFPTPEVSPLWKRFLNPTFLDNRAFLALLFVGIGVYLPVQYIVKPWGQKLREKEMHRHEVVATSFDEQMAEDTEQKHVFKFKKEPTLGLK